MGVYLVEIYLARGGGPDLAAPASRARRAARDVSENGVKVRYIRSIFVPEDEVCFHLFEAPSAEAVWEAARRASIGAERVVEAVE
jgi:hypothetical protein